MSEGNPRAGQNALQILTLQSHHYTKSTKPAKGPTASENRLQLTPWHDLSRHEELSQPTTGRHWRGKREVRGVFVAPTRTAHWAHDNPKAQVVAIDTARSAVASAYDRLSGGPSHGESGTEIESDRPCTFARLFSWDSARVSQHHLALPHIFLCHRAGSPLAIYFVAADRRGTPLPGVRGYNAVALRRPLVVPAGIQLRVNGHCRGSSSAMSFVPTPQDKRRLGESSGGPRWRWVGSAMFPGLVRPGRLIGENLDWKGNMSP